MSSRMPQHITKTISPVWGWSFTGAEWTCGVNVSFWLEQSQKTLHFHLKHKSSLKTNKTGRFWMSTCNCWRIRVSSRSSPDCPTTPPLSTPQHEHSIFDEYVFSVFSWDWKGSDVFSDLPVCYSPDYCLIFWLTHSRTPFCSPPLERPLPKIFSLWTSCCPSSSLSSLLVLLTSRTMSFLGSTRTKLRHSNVRWPAEEVKKKKKPQNDSLRAQRKRLNTVTGHKRHKYSR